MKQALMPVLFVGVGAMGRPMVKNLARAGIRVTAMVRKSPSEYADLTREGIRLVHKPGEISPGRYVVVTVLPNGSTVKEVVLGRDPLAAILESGSVVIDMSTSEVQVTHRISRALENKGIGFLDAPVSGGVKGAHDGTLTTIVGGEDSTLIEAQPYFAPMTRKQFHAGPVGAGQTAKACNNLLVAACMAASMEAMALGMSSGLNPETLLEIIRNSTGTNWQLENTVPDVVLKNDFSVKFARSLLLKDLGIAAEIAEQARMHLYLTNFVCGLYELSGVVDDQAFDFSSVALLYPGFRGRAEGMDGVETRD